MNGMPVPIALIFSVAAGLALGLFYFGGLWWTVRIGMASDRRSWLFLLSLLFRTVVVVAGFYWVGNGSLYLMLACLAGFILARAALTRWLRALRPGVEEQTEDHGQRG